MNGVLADLAQARSALRTAARQAAELLRSLPDPQALVPGLDWTVGQTAAHMVAAPVNYLPYATGQATPETTIDLREGNLERIRQVGSQDLTELADLLVEGADRYLEGPRTRDDRPQPVESAPLRRRERRSDGAAPSEIREERPRTNAWVEPV